MGRTNVDPPTDPAAMAALLNGDAPAAAKRPKNPVATAKPASKLRAGRMGDPCTTQLPNNKGRCKGKLSDFSRVQLTAQKITRITLYCRLCRVVQAQSDVADMT